MQGAHALTPSDVWAVGYMQSSGGAARDTQPIALHFDGDTWQSVPPPLPPGATGAYLVSVSGVAADDVWAVGSTDAPAPEPFVAHWDGVDWAVSTTPETPGYLGALYDLDAISSTDVWAVGESNDPNTGGRLILHWDGVAWATVAAAVPAGPLLAISGATQDSVWTLADSNDIQDRILRWNGSVWKRGVVDVPADVFVFHSVTAVTANETWFGGFDFEGGVEQARIKRWDGQSWSDVHIGESAWAVYNIAAASVRDVWIAGADSAFSKVYGYHWDGQRLSSFPQPNPTGSRVMLEEGAVTALPTGDVWAAGTRVPPKGARGPYLLHLCPIVVADDGGTARATRPADVVSRTSLGNAVAWKFHRRNVQAHQIKDSSGMRLFDSGKRGRGGSYTRLFNHGGTYPWRDTLGSQRGEIRIPPTLRPTLGIKTTVRWASKPIRSGFAFDVQVKRPGDDRFTWWKRGVTAQKAEFSPSRAGAYKIRVRLKKVGTGTHSGWSPAVTFQRP